MRADAVAIAKLKPMSASAETRGLGRRSMGGRPSMTTTRTRRPGRRRSRAGPLVFLVGMAALLVVWLATPGPPALPDVYDEVDLSVSGMH